MPQGWSIVAGPGVAGVDVCELWAGKGLQIHAYRSGAYVSCGAGPIISRAGDAFWVYAPGAVSLDAAPASPAPLTLSLQRGWNLIGNPFDRPVPWNETVLADGRDMRASAKMFALLICYNPETAAYETATALAPGRGCVVLAREPVALTLPAPGDEQIEIIYEPFDPGLVAEDPETGLPYIAGQLLVQKAAGAGAPEFESAVSALGFRIAGRNDFLGLYQLEMPAGMNESAALAALAATPAAGPAARHIVLTTGAYAPDDPPWQGGPAEQRWAFERVNAPGGWELAPSAGSTVAVVDTGVDGAHPDLAGRVSGGADFIAPGGDGATDADGHGTHVAGIIAAAIDNATGIAGVCPQCRIVPVRVCSAGACPFFAVMNGVVHAANSGARVINISLEGNAAPGSPEWQIFQNVIKYAADRGAFVTAAAGNGGGAVDTVVPAALDGVYCTAAMDQSDNPAPFTNNGPAVDLFAPGVSVYSLEPGGASGMRDGTSMAAAFTAGAAGLIAGFAPTVTNRELEDVLREFSDSLGIVPVHNGGVLDVDAALRQFSSGNRPPVIESLHLSETAIAADGAVTATAVARDPDGDFLEYRWEVSGGSLQGPARDVKTWDAFPERGRYAVRVTVTDSKGGSATAQAALDAGLDGLTHIAIYPRTASISAGDIIHYRAFGHFTDGSVRAVRPLWIVDNGRGVMSPEGMFTALAGGLETVRVELGGFSDSLTVAVDSALPMPALTPAAMISRNPAPAMDTGAADFIVIGDLDGDADNDFIAVAGLVGAPNIVHMNNGGYAFAQSSFPVNSQTNMAVLADVDHDADLDLIEAGILTTPGVRFFANNGAGGFALSMTLGGADVRSVYVVDMDHDTMPDIVAGVAGIGNSPTIYWNSTTSFNAGNFTTIAAAACGQKHTLAGDVNNDGWADIVNVCSTGSTEVFYNVKNRTFSYAGPIAGSNLGTRFAHLADVDGDGDLDYVALRAYNDAGTDYEEYAIFKNNGSGAFTYFGASPRWQQGSGATQFDMADHNNDGDIDIYAAPKSATAVGLVYSNNGSGTFTASVDTFPAPVDTLTAGDLSGDRSPDAINNRETGIIWENNNSTPNNAPSAPTGLKHYIFDDDDLQMEWDWAQAGDSTTRDLVTFDLRAEYSDFTSTQTVYYGVAPERFGNLGHATHSGAGTYGYNHPDTGITTGRLAWSVRAVDTQFGRGPWSATATVGCPVVSNLADTGMATLRDCIDYANNNPGETITFDSSIHGGTISVLSELPALFSGDTVIDGRFADITLDGAGCAGCNGLTIDSTSNVTIWGMTIDRFSENGIFVNGSLSSTIGGDRSAGQGNVITRNGQAGIQVTGSSGISIQGNAMGTNFGAATGTQSLGNTYGIRLSRGSSFVQNIIIGDSAAGAPVNGNLGNIIAYNTTNGVRVDGGTAFGQNGASRNRFTNNAIYANGGAADKAVYLAAAGAHGSPAPIAPPVITNVACSATPGYFDVTFEVSNLTVANSDIYFYRVDNDVSAPLTAPDTTAGEGFEYIGYATAGGVIGVNTKTASIPFNDADGDYISAVRYHLGAGPANNQGFSEFANNVAIPSCGPCPGYVVTNGNATGDGSLYACIQEANNNPGWATITFNAAYTIQPVTATPYIIQTDNAGVGIDGDTDGDGDPDVIIDGTNCANCHGFVIRSSNNTIKNLSIVNFDDNATCPTDNFFYRNCAGVYMKDGASSNKIQGCRIGTSDGTASAKNYYGIFIDDGSSSNTVGTDNDGADDAAEGNLISGNMSFGVFITGTGAYSQNNAVMGNIIGADINGTSPLANNANGIYVYQRATNNLIGGPAAVQRNVISGNNGAGVAIDHGNCSGNKVQGNYIGTDITGTLAVPNSRGVYIKTDTKNNIIGTDGDGSNDAAERNVISGNSSYGVFIDGNFTSNNRISGNYIGLQKGGIAALANDIGVFLNGGGSNFIGTNNDLVNDDAEGNIISGNTRYGISLDGAQVNRYVVMKNIIGLAADGSTQPNGREGVLISSGANNNLIGSATDTAYANVIANNGTDGSRDGVFVQGANSDNNAILRNSIYNNQGLGIRLNNDGANQNMAPPVITNVTNTGGSAYSISGTSSCGAGCTIEIFIVDNAAAPLVNPDPSGTGEAYSYATRTLTTAGGAWSVSSVNIPSGTEITATVTDTDTASNPFGNTSPFADNEPLPVSECPLWQVTTNADSGVGTLRKCIEEANASGSGQTITFTISNQTITPLTELPAITQDSVSIDGAAQNITVSGASCAACDGFTFASNSGGVNALTITGFTGVGNSGILIDGASGTVVTGCKIGNNGVAAAPNYHGITITNGASSSTIGGSTPAQRNIISGNSQAGVIVYSNSNKIYGNFVGLNAAGTAALANGMGIELYGNSNLAGGDAAGTGNVIAGNTTSGLGLRFSAQSNVVRNNIIGMNQAGTAFSNGTGILIASGATRNMIGGLVSAPNLIAKNTGAGVRLSGATTIRNTISINTIYDNGSLGIDLDGAGSNSNIAAPAFSCSVDNGGGSYWVVGTSSCNNCTVELFQVDSATVTADLTGAGEAFTYLASATTSATGSFGVSITFPAAAGGTLVTGTVTDALGNTSEFAANYDFSTVCDQCPNWEVTSTADSGIGTMRACIDKANTTGGPDTIIVMTGGAVTLASSLPTLTDDETTIDGNGQSLVIDGAGTVDTGLIIQSADNTVQELAFVGFASAAVWISGSGAQGNTFAANRVGINFSGTADANAVGMVISGGAHDNVIGGDRSTSQGNVISGNSGHGIVLTDSGTDANIIRGNNIGVNAAGDAKLANGGSGVYAHNGPSGTIIGTDAANLYNVIGGNASHGIHLSNSTSAIIKGNYIGARYGFPTDLGNGVHGVFLENADNATLGGTVTAEERNYICHNASDGLRIDSSDSASLYANYIGSNETLTDLGNSGNGVNIINGSTQTKIGDLVRQNYIVYNTLAGISVNGAAATGNGFIRNRIFENGGKGVSLLNGANASITRPTITVVDAKGGGLYDLTVSVPQPPVNCSAGTPCRLEIFAVDNSGVPSVASDPSGAGEAFNFATAQFITTSCAPSCSVVFTDVNFGGAFPGSTKVTASVTGGGGNTSEFSNNFDLPTTSTCPVVSVNTDARPAAPSGSLRDCIKRANTGAAGKNITFDASLAGQTIQLVGPLDIGVDSSAIYTSGISVTNATGGEITIRGTGTAQNCLHIMARTSATAHIENITVDGLTFLNCNEAIRVYNEFSANPFDIQNVTIRNNHIGVTRSGTSGAGYINSYGITILHGKNVTIENNTIAGSLAHGILARFIKTTGLVVRGNYIGTNAAGATGLGNTQYGIFIGEHVSNTTIGGTTPAQRNVISSNGTSGIYLENANTAVITGNYIGTNPAGTAALPNGKGITLFESGSSRIGGSIAAGEGNVISGNTAEGIRFNYKSGGCIVNGNSIGVDAAGNPLGNGSHGVHLAGYEDNRNHFGEQTADTANIIANNGGGGIIITPDYAGPSTNMHRNLFSQNRIYNNAGMGLYVPLDTNMNIRPPVFDIITPTAAGVVDITGTTSPACASCRVELFRVNHTGSPAVASDTSGAGEAWEYLTHATTTAAGAWSLSGFAFATATGEWMTATLTDSEYNTSEFATNAMPNYCPVVYSNLDDGPNTLRECISQANSRGGAFKTITFHTSLANSNIFLDSSLPAFATDGITVTNNSGGQITVNGQTGNFNCFTINSANNAIRGLSIVSCSGAGNPSAIRISGAAAQNNTIAGNKIGTNNASAAGLGNGAGVSIESGATGNTIGGAAPADANVIASSTSDGIVIDAASTNNVFGNYIGTNSALAAGLGNGGHGVRLQNGATNNTIGGVNPGQAINTILNNGSAGISSDGAASTGNDFSRNKVYGNGWLGIALTGGAHNALAQPVISSIAKTGAATFNIIGDGADNSCNNCTVELFRVDDTVAGVTPDGSGAGEAFVFLDDETASATGAFAFYGVAVSGGSWLTVTVTDPVSGTSEFSINKEAVNDPPFVWSGTPAFSPVSIIPDGAATATLSLEADDPNGLDDITTAPASVVIDMSPVNGASGSITMNSGAAGANGGLMFSAGSLTAYSAAGIATGSYILTATVTDQWGATGTATVALIIDNAPPTVDNSAASPSTVIPGTPNVAFSADVFDFNGLTDIQSVTIDLSPITGPVALTMVDDGTSGDTAAGDGTYTIGGYTIPLAAPFGNHTIVVTATDKSGASATDSFILQMGGMPTVVSVSFNPAAVPPDGSTITNISVVVDDPDGQADIARVYIILDPIKTAPLTLDLVYSGPVAGGFEYTGTATVDPGFLPATYTLTAWASDSMALADDGTGDLGVSNLPPDILSATATPYDVATGVASFDELAFTAVVTDPNGLADIYAVTIDLSPIGGPSAFVLYDDATNGDTTAADGSYTFTPFTVPAAAPAGTHTLTVSATDGDATDTATITIRVNSPPAITNMEFVPPQTFADGVTSTQLRIEIYDADGRQDISSVTVDLASLGIVPAVQSLAYSGPAGVNTFRYVLNVTPLAGYATGVYLATGTVTDIFTRTDTDSAPLELVTTMPNPPVMVTVTSSSSTVAVKWRSPFLNTDGTALTNLAGHNIWRRTATGTYDPVPYYVDATSATNTIVVYTDAAVTDFETYCYKATAYNSYGIESAASAEKCVMVYPPAWVYHQTCGDVVTGGFPAPSTPGFFNRPMDVAVDDQGNIFVADTDNHRIQKFDKFCEFKGWRGGFGNTPGKFKSPSSITWNPADGLLYVTDRYDRVQVFDTSDTLDVQPGEFKYFEPITIQSGPGGTFFLTQTGSPNVVQVDGTGAAVATFTFTLPRAVDTDSSGNIFVTDVSEHKVYKLDSGGGVITSWGGAGSAPGLFNEPGGLAVDSAGGFVFVADTKNNRIQIFDLDGALVNIAGYGVGMDYGQLRYPAGLAVSPNGQLAPLFTSLIIADRYNNRVQEFGPPGS